MTNNKIFSKHDGDKSSNSKVFDDTSTELTLNQLINQWVDEHSYSIIMVWTEEGILKYVSRSIETILNLKQKSLIGKHWTKVFIDTRKHSKPIIPSKNDKKFKSFRVTMRDKDKNILTFNSKTSSLKHLNKKYFVTSLMEITQKVKLEELVIQSENLTAAGQLAAGIAHEIRNPLTSLKGFLQLLSAGIDAKDAYYKIMTTEIEKIETITSELLHLAKPAATKKQPESIIKMISEVANLLRSEARMKNICLYFGELHDVFIFCNQTQIKQALINIIKNAIEAVEPNTKITLLTKKTSETITIDIIDEGPGVPVDMIKHLNKAFYTTKQEGTGLGLMITQKILDEHNGTLKIIKNSDKGSTFRLIFPLVPKNND